MAKRKHIDDYAREAVHEWVQNQRVQLTREETVDLQYTIHRALFRVREADRRARKGGAR